MGSLLLVSADGHVGATPEVYREYLESRFHPEMESLNEEGEIWRNIYAWIAQPPEMLAVIDRDGSIASGGIAGSYDVERRLAEMDREGVVAEIVFGKVQIAPLPFFSVASLPYAPDVRFAGARAYHRWLADFMAESNGRIFGVADPGPCLDLDATLAELAFVRDHGFVSVTVPRAVVDDDLPPITDRYYDRFWAACVDLGLVLSVHAGHGRVQGEFLSFCRSLTERGLSTAEMMDASMNAMESTQTLDYPPRQVLWQLMLGGVLDRFPDLRLAFTEVRADWIPATLAHLDRRFAAGGTPLSQPPSEYWRRHCYAGVSSMHRAEVEMRAEIGIDQIMFGVDFPHPEGTWPNTWDWIRDAFRTVAEGEARQMLGENAIACYGLDRVHLEEIAREVAPSPADLLGSRHEVDGALIDHFDLRCAYRRPAEQVDPAMIDRLFDEDLATVD